MLVEIDGAWDDRFDSGFCRSSWDCSSAARLLPPLCSTSSLPLASSYAVEFDYNQELRQRFTVGQAGLVSKFGVQLFRFNDSLDTSSDVIISIGSSSFPVTSFYGARVSVSEIPVINSFADPVPWTYVDVARGKRLAQPGNQFSIKVYQTPDSLNANATAVYWRASGTEQGYSGGEYRAANSTLPAE